MIKNIFKNTITIIIAFNVVLLNTSTEEVYPTNSNIL